MRVTDKMTINQVNGNLMKNRYEMSELQNQAATQKRINKPSDDPLGTARVLESKADESQQKQFIKSLYYAKGFLDYTDQSLGELSDIIVRVKELAVSQAGDASANEETRKVAAAEVEQLLSQSVQIGNRKLGERYIFGGFKTINAPFDRSGNYEGDSGEINIQVNKDSFITMNIPGDRTFLGQGISAEGIAAEDKDIPRTSDDLVQRGLEQQKKLEADAEHGEAKPVRIYSGSGRGLSSIPEVDKASGELKYSGVNVFDTLKSLTVALKTNSKEEIQSTLDVLDKALNQVVITRSQVGARVMSLSNTLDSLQKSVLDSRIKASQIEDADVFQLVSDINRGETALKATLESSGRLIQPSLLDFLK
jgi:flagellar hook-associated protein 3 FlgL